MTAAEGHRLLDDSDEALIPLLVAVLCAIEIVVQFVHVGVGALLDGIALGGILVVQGRRGWPTDRRSIVPLALVPILRLLSLTAPLPGAPIVLWLPLVGLPLVVASVLAARSAGLSRAAVGLRVRVLPVQLAIVALGIPLGFATWLVAPSFLWATRGTPPVEMAVAAILLGVFVGVAEEVVFRGVVQAGLTITYARGAVPLTAILYGAVYLGSFSIVAAAWMTFVGFLYGVIAQQTRSIVGTAASHALLVASGLVVFPAIGVHL